MIEIGKNTIFQSNESSYVAISKIIEFQDLIGHNQIFFYKKNSNLHHWIKTKKILFESDLKEKILQNLFRIDTIIIEDNSIISLSSIRKITDLPLILIYTQSSPNYSKIISNFNKIDKIYHFSRPYPLKNKSFPLNDENFLISESISGWSSNISDIKKKYIRDKKINDILK